VRGEEAKKYQLLEEACLEGDRNMELMLYKMGDAAKQKRVSQESKVKGQTEP
jgi:hypothetical protein